MVGITLFAACAYTIAVTFDPYWDRVQQRLNELDTPAQGGSSVGASFDSQSKQSWLAWLGHWIDLPKQADRPSLQQHLAKAGIYHPSAVSWFMMGTLVTIGVVTISTLVGGMLLGLDYRYAILLTAVAGTLGAFLPRVWLHQAIAKQHLQLRRSLPDLLDLMTVCLQGGLSLQETIRRVSEELKLAHPSLAAELDIVQRDVELGSTVDQALKRFATRSGYEGVRTLSTFIREAQRFGTNISEALRSHADMLRSQREQSAEENAQKAAVKILLPTLLLIFPAIFIVAVGPAIIQIQQAFMAD